MKLSECFHVYSEIVGSRLGPVGTVRSRIFSLESTINVPESLENVVYGAPTRSTAGALVASEPSSGDLDYHFRAGLATQTADALDPGQIKDFLGHCLNFHAAI
jgi:hypothetical protein